MNFKLIIIPVILIASVLVFFSVDSINMDRLCAEKGGVRDGDVCMVELAENVETEITKTSFDLSKVSFMKPNSKEFFYYPNPEDTTNRDVFQKFILIRLPEHLGGAVDDVSAFRAYSALSVGVHCQMNYWPDQGRQRMEDPCWGSIYRPIDGLMIMGERPVVNTSPIAIPYLDLSLDENGSLHVEPPVWTMDKNGVIGEGRNITLEQVRQGSQILVDSYEMTNPNHPSIPIDFAGQILVQINPSSNNVEFMYHDFSSSNWHGITLYISNVSAQDQKYFQNFAQPNSEFWQIDDTLIRVGGSAMDKNSSQPEKFRVYDVEFILDGFKFAIEGQNLEFIKKSIVSHYFPENSYDDLFLVSSTVKK